ncbi:MAG: rRNA maturation RNase YbeY [Candidatus Binatia bacterium]
MSVEIVTLGKGKRITARRVKEKAERILEILNQNRAELSLAIVGNREIQKLNSRYRNRDEPTDVLSFPSEGYLPTGEKLLGDVIISVEQAKKQAREGMKKLEEELETLLIHGILHLLGYEHEGSVKEARRMRRMEEGVLRRLCGPGDLQV